MYLGINCSELLEKSDPYTQLKKLFYENNICFPNPLEIDGKIHRFQANPEKNSSNRSGWYVLFDDDCPYGSVGDWSRDINLSVCTHGSTPLSAAEQAERDAKIREVRKKAEEERKQLNMIAARECMETWEKAELCNDHPYLKKKGLKSGYGAKISEGKLLIPFVDKEGQLTTLQEIDAEGNKKYHKDGITKGSYYVIGNGEPVFMAEGFATAASIYEATGKACVVANNAGNLKNVARIFPNTTIVADNDKSGVGEKAAKESGLPYILIPEVGMDANDYAQAGKDLKGLLIEKKEPRLKLISGNNLFQMPCPPSWLIKGWVLRGDSFTMTFGPSGNGKTFVLIDQMLSVATGQRDWHGFKVNRGKVLYLCGEGQFVSRERIICWMQQHRTTDLSDFMICEQAEHLDGRGGVQAILEALEYNNFKPDWIVVDTLNRYMEGDENDTQDAGVFISNCSILQKECNCNITLVHHTGLSEDAQKRARGSSAFRGALDMQFMITKRNSTFCVEQTKNKGGQELEPIYLRLEDHVIDGWYDEDGEAVSSAILVQADGMEEQTNEESKDAKLSKYERGLLQACKDYGYSSLGHCYITMSKLYEWKDAEYRQANPMQPDENNDKYNARKNDSVNKWVDRACEGLKSSKYFKVSRRKENGSPDEIEALDVRQNGVIEPYFSIDLRERKIRSDSLDS